MILKAARDSDDYQKMVRFVRGGDVDVTDPAIMDIKNNKDLSIDEKYGEALIYRNNQLMPPKEIRKELIRLAHVAHQSDDAMWRTVRQVWYWPSLKYELSNFYKTCRQCMENKRSKLRTEKKRIQSYICMHLVTIGVLTVHLMKNRIF